MLEVRELEEDDNDAYRSLWLRGVTEESDFFRIAAEDDPHPSIPTQFTLNSFTLGAFYGSELVGIVSFESDTRAKLRHKGLISRMLVRRATASQGVGRALLQMVITYAKRINGLRYVYLTVLASNPRAIHFYSRQGFQEFARELGSVKIGTNYVDELQMAHQLLDT